jgi:L-aspartate oxidase
VLLAPAVRGATQQAMSAGAGVLRSAASLSGTARTLEELGEQTDAEPRTEAWEATNLQQVAGAMAALAARREETRGSHWREDHPQRDDARWRVRQVLSVDEDGCTVTEEAVA